MNLKKVCANCHNKYIEGDRYCRFCGAPMGQADYIAENFARIYGPPPIQRTHTCESCGHSWNTVETNNCARFCPLCGGSAPAVNL